MMTYLVEQIISASMNGPSIPEGGGMDTPFSIARSPAFFLTLLEAIQDVVYVVTPEMTITYVNSVGAALFRKTTDEIVGKSLAELFPADTVERQQLHIRKVLETGKTLFVEYPYAFPDRQRWLNARLFPLKDESGRVTAVLGTSLDISERKLADQAIRETHRIILEEREKQLLLLSQELRESEEQYRKLVEISPDMILVSVARKLHYVNPAFVRALGGTDASQFTGKPIERFVALGLSYPTPRTGRETAGIW